jgi:hypothetical protein
MLGSGVPLPLVSKVLRHSQLSITSDLYGHLTPEIARGAADTFGAALDAAGAERAAEQAITAATAKINAKINATAPNLRPNDLGKRRSGLSR